MTLPASFPLSMSQIATELGLSLPLSLNHSWVLQLAQVGGLPLSFSQLLGKTGRFDGNLLGHFAGSPFNIVSIQFSDAPFFGGTLHDVEWTHSGSGVVNLFFDTSPNWSGNIIVRNNTTGVSVVFGKVVPTQWQAGAAGGNFIRVGVTDSFTVLPST